MKFLKKLSVAHYLLCAASVIGLVALIIAGYSSSITGYAISEIGIIIALSVIGILATVAAIVLTLVFDKKLFVILAEVLTYVAAITFAVSLGLLFAVRGEMIGWIQVINGPLDQLAFHTAIASGVMYLIAGIALVVSAFFKIKKEEN